MTGESTAASPRDRASDKNGASRNAQNIRQIGG